MVDTQKKKKILFFISDLNGGGAQRVLVNLTNALVADGYRIAIATNTEVGSAFPIHPEIKVLNFREGCNTTRVWSKLGVYRKLKAYHNIRHISRNESPDIIVSFLREMNFDVLLATKGLHVPVICSEHTTVQRIKVPFVVQLLYKTATAITVLTKSDYKFFRPKMKNLVYMPNPSDSITEKSIGYERKKVVLAAGRVNDWRVKGFDNLLKSWGLICNDFPEWSLFIAGDGNQESFDTLRLIASESGCTNVDYLGFRSDINQLMAQSSIFCLSSRFEGLPMVLIEAMNAGCCCIAFDCITGPNEIIVNDKSGILVKEQSVEDLAKSLREVMADDALRERLSFNAPKTVKKYNSYRIVNRWKILFEKLLSKS